MVIDSSALVAIAFKEQGYENFFNAIDSASITPIISSATLLETHLVLSSRQDERLWHEAQEFLKFAGVLTVPFDENTLQHAIKGYQKYGKGRGHKAQLNYGDCITYGTVKAHELPLLFKGNDFTHTDIKPAI